MIINNILKGFPEKYTPRDKQAEVLKLIETAINEGNKYIILNSPTGTGKSLISATLANNTEYPSRDFISLVDEHKMFEKKMSEFSYKREALSSPLFGAFTLTTTKLLQNQYDKLFENSTILKGKRNYTCAVDDEFDVDFGPCLLTPKLFKECQCSNKCPFLNAKNELLKSRFGVLNYTMFMCLPEHVKRRQIIICDEASELEDEIVNHYSAVIEYKKIPFIKIDKLIYEDNRSQYWLTELATKLKQYTDEKLNTLTRKKIKNYDMTKIKIASDMYDKIVTVLENWYSCEYIIEKSGDRASFTPLKASNLSKNIFDMADVVILMSATIIDHKTFAKSLGIQNYKYIDIDSTFDPDKSPIYCPGTYNLNYANLDKNINKVVDQALEICSTYEDKKGIIHTHNFKITEALQRRTNNNNRFLFRENGVTNEHILEEHYIRKNTILVSPSMGFGTDLHGEHGEFQIIMKLPYLPLGTKRIKKLFEEDKDWYQMKMLINLVQMCGRCTRSKEDSSTTFILDGQTIDVLKKNWNKLPNYFKSRLK